MRRGFKVALIGMLLCATSVFAWNENNWNDLALALRKLKYSIIPQTTNTLTLGDASHYFSAAYITSTTASSYVVADGGYVGLGAAKGRFVFDDETQDTITALACDIYMGNAAADCGDLYMIRGAQTSDPQVKFALSADANGNFSIVADTGDITYTAADDIFLNAQGGALTIDAINAAADSTVTITNSDGTYKADLAVEGAVSYDEADWTGGNVISVPVAAGTALQTACTAATAGDTLELGAGTYALTTNSLTPGKALTIRGKGIDSTTITQTTGVIVLNANNIKFENLTIQNSAASGNAACISGTSNLTGLAFKNVKIVVDGAGSGHAIQLANCSAEFYDCSISKSGTAGYMAFYYYGDSSATSTHTANLYNTYVVCANNSASLQPAVQIADGGTTYAITMNMYHGGSTSTNAGAGDSVAIKTATGTDAAFNGYNSRFSGKTQDVIQADGSTLTLSNCTLVNNTTSGTISYVNPTSIAKSGNIYYSYTNEDLDALIASAKITAGDTIILGNGTYTITDDIDVSKAVNIVGQGKWTGTSGTLINCATASKNVFDLSVVNTRISNLSITNSGGSGKGINTAQNLSGFIFTNIDFNLSGAGGNTGIYLNNSSATIRDCVGTIVSSDATAVLIYLSNGAGATGAPIVNAYNCYGNCTGGGGSGSLPYIVYNNNVAVEITMNLYDCQGYGATGGAADSGAYVSSATTFNSKIYAYNCTFSGADGDVIQTGTNVLSLSNCVLVNGTSSGTITMAGTVKTANLHVAGSTTTRTLNFATDAQGDDDYVITLSPAPTAYTTGMPIYFTANTANTGACTVNVNGLGAKSLKSLHDQDPADSYIEAGSVVHAVYDGTNFQIMNPDANP